MARNGAVASPSDMGQQDLRHGVGAQGGLLDVRIQTRKKIDGGYLCLTLEDMRDVLRFRREHIAGQASTAAWATEQEAADTDSNLAYAFWANLSGEKSLPDQARQGLASAATVAGFRVQLLGYEVPDNLPGCVAFAPAEPILRQAVFKDMLEQGVLVSHIADFVRLKAILNGRRGGWFLDCDTQWVRKPGPSRKSGPWPSPAFGHFFGSLEAAPCHRGTLKDFRHWSVHFLKEPLDKLYLASPFFFPASSPVLADLGAWVDTHFQDASTALSMCHRDYSVIMDKIRSSIRQHGLEGAIAAPEVCSAVSYAPWKKEKVAHTPINEGGRRLLETIASSAMCVNALWQSARAGGAYQPSAHERASLLNLHPDSLWAHVSAMKAGGVSPAVKRRKLGKLPWQDLSTWVTSATLPCHMQFANSPIATKYTLRKFLKAGSYGRVYQGEDRSTGRTVAIKTVSDADGDVGGKEFYFHCGLSDHQNIISVLDGYVTPFFMVLVMERASMNLHEYLTQRDKKTEMTEAIAIAIARQAADALQYVHSRGLIHRDLHSGNILMCLAGPDISETTVRLTDFGMACLLPDASQGKKHKGSKMTANVVGGYNAGPELLFSGLQTCRYTAGWGRLGMGMYSNRGWYRWPSAFCSFEEIEDR